MNTKTTKEVKEMTIDEIAEATHGEIVAGCVIGIADESNERVYLYQDGELTPEGEKALEYHKKVAKDSPAIKEPPADDPDKRTRHSTKE